MISKKDILKVSETIWKIEKSYKPGMGVPALIFAKEKMLEDILYDRSLEQLVNVTSLPGIQMAALAMPDIHEGYGFPIGGVAATLWPKGVISPGGIGYDINCGVRLLKSNLKYDDIKEKLHHLGAAIFNMIPSGVGKSGNLKLSDEELDQVLKTGSSWMVKRGMGFMEDLERTESGGSMEQADPSAVSDKAKKRGKDQLGTLGAGNHFIEIDVVEEIDDQGLADAFGLFLGQIVVLIHTGSRGLGHQVATDYVRLMVGGMKKYGINVPDRELACVPFDSPEGQQYFSAMSAAANFAWANRQVISHKVREAWADILGKEATLDLLYDVAHNIAKIEEHKIDDAIKKLIVHRKGATRAFGPGHLEVQSEYRESGQPVIIPGSMGTSSYVLAGTNLGMELSFGSSCHGAGRQMSRQQAKGRIQGNRLVTALEKKGIYVYCGSLDGLAEEAPEAYKDVESVVDVIQQSGIAKKVAKLKPLVVIKG